MEPVLRPARPEDQAAITAFTQGTFPWGDYIERVYEQWLADAAALTLVAEIDGEVVGLARGTLLSPAEAWAQGLRVHPDHRRRRIGTALLENLAAWAARSGARVIRLSSEDWNEAARSHFATVGFRPAGAWMMAERPVGEGSPVPEGNGGKRVPAPERLTAAPITEPEAAILSWASGPLDRAAHGLFPMGWTWRHLTLEDLETAARRRALWQGRPGWAVGEVEDDTFRVTWLSTGPEDARVMARALVDLAFAAGAERIEVVFPVVDWLSQVFEQIGCTLHPLTVYARGL